MTIPTNTPDPQTAGVPAAPTPLAATPPALPSVHVRAVITWIAIFPLVAAGMMITGPVTLDWHPVLRALVLTVVVVPLAVYLVVPRLMGLYVRMRARRAR
ncbi:hypothetical protein FVQ89_00045 [Homoserinibacter sp. GY 40078]|nr:hypothetical protein FVQ89_00045 [Homoserinibacter sp. GY 40078]